MCQHETLAIEYSKTLASGAVTLWYACKGCNLAFHAYRAVNAIDVATGYVKPIKDWAPTLGEHYPSLSL